MGKLIVEAAFGSQKLVDGSDALATLCVSVTDEAGGPVAGLKKAAFKVAVIQSEVVGGEAGNIYQPIELASVTDLVLWGDLHGVYQVNIKPQVGYRWGKSRIVVGLQASRVLYEAGRSLHPKILSSDQGQTLVAFQVY
jgi:hypothetical protein